ncbi:hypothetical protein Ahy_A02g007433 isoform B [Arachis hypogaea]|uniref:Uncharacterized protein n=1 Tax=Arachis hypogaea TaxID=3818 RepID=A0A445ECX2_ARAHY|nr:hypothetical protein Ahy_A02g007433 isoform B [Arachis hypogaea]
MELDADGQGQDNGLNLWDKMPEDNTKRQWKFIEFDYAADIKWALKTLGDRWKPQKKAEILAANPSDIQLVEWTIFVDH